ncbi:hypothetical protein [Parabacteroides goldsteinii]|uniref:hypothetical protein n=1 Tax=Parabacteroides goldsteinii TaxID=328812 RepID=UPI002671CB10|nr:hypothetical protein [Parabacteroides goldsteinii]
MFLIALTAALAAMLGHHLGLVERLSELAMEVAKCPKCTTFWVTLIVLVFSGCGLVAAVALSLAMAYLSFWFGFVLVELQKLYDWIWKRIDKK